MIDKVQLESAARSIVATGAGRLFVEHLKSLYEQDREALVMSEMPEQVRRLQGSARRTSELLRLFNV